MRRIFFPLLLLCLATPLLAAVVYEQLPTAEGYVSDNKTTPGDFVQVEADQFILTTTARLDTLEWWSADDVGAHQRFDILFLVDDQGLPGEDAVSSTGWSSMTQRDDNGWTLYIADFTSGPSVILQAGVPYWICIIGDDPYSGDPDWDEVFHWAVDGTTNGYVRYTDPDNVQWTVVDLSQPAFRIRGTTDVGTEISAWGEVKALFR